MIALVLQGLERTLATSGGVMDGAKHFVFSGYEYVEIIADIARDPDAIGSPMLASPHPANGPSLRNPQAIRAARDIA